MACVAGGQTGRGCLFRTPFLWLLSFGEAKESNINQKKEGALLTPSFKFRNKFISYPTTVWL